MHIKEALTTEILPETKQKQIFPVNDEQEFVTTLGRPSYFCVGIIDIVDSTKNVSKISPNKTSEYYETFLNTMAKIVSKFNGQILKTMGDSLLFYFPDTCYAERKFGFLSCLECGFSMVASHEKLKILLAGKMLPPIDFRISFDYGNVTMMRTGNSAIDLVGPTINTCSKINGICPVNEMVIGSDLFEKAKNFKEYKFKNCGHFSIDLKHPYPVFSISRKVKK